MSNFERTANWLKACGKEQHNKEHLSVQIGCHIEEFVEFLATIRIGTPDTMSEEQRDAVMGIINDAVGELRGLGEALKKGHLRASVSPIKRAESLDALCDLQVTGDGVAYLAGMNKEEADRRVLTANDAKLVDGKPVLLEGGKIGKPAGWTPADLSDCVTINHH